MVTGTTKSGFRFTLREGAAEDFRVVEALADADSGDASAVLRGTVQLVRLLLGEDGKRALYDHLIAQHGSVPTARVSEEITEILTLAREHREVKN